MPVRRAGPVCVRTCQDGFGATQDNPAAVHPAEIHLHIYGEYKYGMGLMVVVIANATGGCSNIGSGCQLKEVTCLQNPPLKKNDR